ncbi:uncharacterized protein LOC135208135 [Macrobrachium nipponense]|uniref:uncharacterized protein LOC135208135 n=1 Tax=Macrobrachium nipponense TaxID=159736 RepID=UPI0030C88891
MLTPHYHIFHPTPHSTPHTSTLLPTQQIPTPQFTSPHPTPTPQTIRSHPTIRTLNHPTLPHPSHNTPSHTPTDIPQPRTPPQPTHTHQPSPRTPPHTLPNTPHLTPHPTPPYPTPYPTAHPGCNIDHIPTEHPAVENRLPSPENNRSLLPLETPKIVPRYNKRLSSDLCSTSAADRA